MTTTRPGVGEALQVRCDFCRRQVNPKGGISFRLSFMCAACLKAKSKMT